MFGRSARKAPQFSRDRDFVVETVNHRLQYQAAGGTLVVAFDDAARSREMPFAARPTWGEKFYRAEGHSLLGVIARSNDWFRCQELIDGLKSLQECGFFSQFEKVVMTGASMGGFAAGAFAGLSPGCIVIAMSPQATRDPRKVPWESRFPNGKIQNWNLSYNDAAIGAKSAARTYIFFDSLNRQDLRHAKMFERAGNADLMPIPAGGHGVPPILVQMGLIKDVTRDAIAGTLSREAFFTAMRRRKQTPRYYRILTREALYRGHNAAAIRVCDIAIKKFPNGDFLETKAIALAAAGRPILALQAMDEARKQLLAWK